MKVHLLFVLVLAFGLASSQFPCGVPTAGVILPRDTNYLVGQDVLLQCILNKNNTIHIGQNITIKSSFLTFKFKSKPLGSSGVVIQDEKEAQFWIKNGQKENGGIYYCLANVSGTPFLVCSTLILFGYPPENATNFKCRSYNWNVLNCSWTAPENPVNVSYSLSYETSYMWPPYPCPKEQGNSCQWNLSSNPLYIKNSDKLYFTLVGENGLGNKSRQNFKIDHYSIVVPGKPMNLKPTNVTPTELSLTWEHRVPFKPSDFRPGICYRVHYKPYYDSDFMIQDAPFNESHITLSSLTPHCWYTIKVQAKSCSAPADAEEDLWSPEASIDLQTKATIPEGPPEFLQTYFEALNNERSRSITVYWKKVEPQHYNGDDFHYNVSIWRTYLHRRRRDTSESMVVSTRRNQYKFDDMDLNSAYTVKVVSVNSLGSSVKNSQIVIAKASELPGHPVHVRPVFEGSGNFTVSWQKPKTAVGGFTIMWCQGENHCEEDLQSMNVSADTTRVYLPLNERDYEFAVASISVDGRLGSGLKWAPCTARINRVAVLAELKATPVSPRKVRVSWKLDCEAQKEVVESYNIFYCKCSPEPCHDSDNITTRNPEAESIEVKGLDPYTLYQFSAVAISKAGHTRKSTECVRTPEDAPSDPPSHVKLSQMSNTSISISWEPSKNPNGVINRYTITYYEIGPGKKQKPAETSNYALGDADYNKNRFNFTLKGLKCFTNYRIAISACVNQSCSEPSALMIMSL